MASLKESVAEICNEIVKEFPGWSFKDGEFKKNIMKHCDSIISGGFAYDSMTTPLQPFIIINHKPSGRLCKNLVGFDYRTSVLGFDLVEDIYGDLKRDWKKNKTIVSSKEKLFLAAPDARKNPERFIDLLEVRTIIQDMLQDGIALLNRYYDQTSEDSLLRGLPPKYEPRFKHDNPPGLNGTAGIAACIAHIYVGDFEFFDWYRSDACKTVIPKKTADIDKISAALPELRRQFSK